MTTLLSVNNYYYPRGGAETVFLEHNHMFERLGWKVVPFAMRHERNLPSAWSEYFVDEIEFGASYSVAEKLVRIPRVIYSLQARQRLGRLLEAVAPDVCHAHNIYHHISPSILGLLKRRHIPVVLTLHDLKIACPAYQMLARDGVCERCRGGHIYNVVRHRCIKDSTALSAVVMAEAVVQRVLRTYTQCVDRFVVPSRFYAEKLAEWGFAPDRFRHVPNFVDVAGLSPNFAPGERYVYFGRLAREKGLHTLIRAAAASRSRLAIAGTGPELASLQELTRATHADVEFLGHLSGTALHAAVRNARAVVIPSEWYENAPMSVLEAYALGKPVIGARIGGIPELVRDGATGFLFESGDVESLAATLRSTEAASAERLSALGGEGRRWVATDFTAEAYSRRMLEVYEELGVHSKGPGDRRENPGLAAHGSGTPA